MVANMMTRRMVVGGLASLPATSAALLTAAPAASVEADPAVMAWKDWAALEIEHCERQTAHWVRTSELGLDQSDVTCVGVNIAGRWYGTEAGIRDAYPWSGAVTEDVVARFKARQTHVDEQCAVLGLDAEREAIEALADRAFAAMDRLRETSPTSIDGALARLDVALYAALPSAFDPESDPACYLLPALDAMRAAGATLEPVTPRLGSAWRAMHVRLAELREARSVNATEAVAARRAAVMRTQERG